MKSRIVVLFIGFTVLWSLLLMRVFVLQIFPHQRLERQEQRQYATTVKIEGRRGSIYDRKGVELAISAPAYSLYGDPSLLWKDRARVSKKIAKILGLKPQILASLLKDKQKRFVWIERQLPLDKVDALKKLEIHGLGFIDEPMRVYPDEDILKSVLGVVGRSGVGLEGVEKQYDAVLRGNPKKFQVRRDARGRPLQVNGILVTEAEDGSDVHLTIDRELQYVLHRELAKTVEEQEAAGAIGVILDAQSSEVRALDAVGLPMGGEKFTRENWRNRPILEAYEPGSTMKTFVIAAGLQKKNWQPNTRFNCENGQFRVGGHTIGEADIHHRFGWLTISEILSFSSNVGMAKMALSLGESSVKEVLSLFGFGRKSGIDLPGEAKGIIREGRWGSHLLSTVSFGHGMTATPLQIANAYAAIANGGTLKVPRITQKAPPALESWRPPWEKDPLENQPKDTRILTASEAQTLRLLLAGVVGGGGTGASAKVPGYPVGGKTGTAQKVNPEGRGYLPGVYVSSFVGMIPANDPRFVIYVAVDSPKKQYYGSQVAGPLFSKVATFAVRHEGLAPRWLNEDQAQGLLPDFNGPKSTDGHQLEVAKTIEGANLEQMPNIKDLTLREVQERLQQKKLRVSIYGSGRVNDFSPSEGTPLNENSPVEIWLTE